MLNAIIARKPPPLGDVHMSIWSDVLAFIQRPDPSRFEPLALRVFRHQFDAAAPYRAYCQERGIRPEHVDSIEAIPAVSTVAFKHAPMSAGTAERTFVTSGTTNGAAGRGRHLVPRLDIYRASALANLARMLFPDRPSISMLALHPTADLMPDSSLSQMISWCIDEFGDGRSLCAATGSHIDVKAAAVFLADSARSGRPVCILSTTAALARLCASLAEAGTELRLAPGSRIMETGGAKGQSRPIGDDALWAAAERWLGVDAAMVINEYGMTEMCSQLYDVTPFNHPHAQGPKNRAETGGRRPKVGPEWLRCYARDPITLRRLPAGTPGLLSFFDLANVGSVSGLVSEDLGVVEGDKVFVLGRTEGEVRGCALGIAEFAAQENGHRSVPICE